MQERKFHTSIYNHFAICFLIKTEVLNRSKDGMEGKLQS